MQQRVVADEVAPARCVGDAERARLVAAGQVEPEVRAVGSSSTTSPTPFPRRHHDLADAHPRQRLDGVVDHRPVVDRQQVLVATIVRDAGSPSRPPDDPFIDWFIAPSLPADRARRRVDGAGVQPLALAARPYRQSTGCWLIGGRPPS
jgi:hypothetical protein